MALTLIATAGAVDANAYCTVEEGNSYHERHHYASTWNSANDVQKSQCLVWATQLLDTYFAWFGVVATQAQALRWPRISAFDRDGRLLSGSAIPQVLKDATAELARGLLASDRTAEADSDGIAALTVGSIEIEYAPGSVSAAPVIPDAVVALLKHLGVYENGVGGAITMRRG